MSPWHWIALLLLALLLVVLAAALQLWRVQQRWRRRIRALVRSDYPHHPVVLVHGLFGFDELRWGLRQPYFRGVAELMRAVGAQVHRPPVGPVSTIATRAAQLAAYVTALPPGRVNLIAHSMGGLDARYAIAHLGLDARVGALITIGTPHRGTPLADLGAAMARRLGLGRVLAAAGSRLEVLGELGGEGMRRFNEQVRDVPGVFYGSVVCHSGLGRLNALLLPSYRYLRRRSGENDGMVPAASQPWGEVLGEVEADHWAQIGWSTHFDAPALFECLLGELAARGL